MSPRHKTLNVQTKIAATICLLGLVLLVYMITVEDEPGALPLLLIVVGAVWYIVTRSRIRSLHS